MVGRVYTIGNFKGGVGKTKLVTMLAYQTAHVLEEKTLVIDMDPQANATKVLAKTGNVTDIQNSIMDGFINENLENEIIPIQENLDLIPASTSFRNLSRFLVTKFPEEEDEDKQVLYLKELIAPLKETYDRIYIDVPPTISDFSDNAMIASDYCIVVLQTQELAFDGVKTYIAYLQHLVDRYQLDLEILGIVPMMLVKGGRVDQKTLAEAKLLFGNNVLETIVNYQERLKAYDVEGIALKENVNGTIDMWDQRAHKLFIALLTELDAHEKALTETR